MRTSDIRKDLIGQLKELNMEKAFLPDTALHNINWASLKIESQQNLDKLKSSSKIYQILAYILLTITGVISFLKVLDLGNTPDLNKAALLILLTVTNALVAYRQRIKIERLEKQFLLIGMLEKVDSESRV